MFSIRSVLFSTEIDNTLPEHDIPGYILTSRHTIGNEIILVIPFDK
jgi:hypothetical protein